jgi:hypothetical protein
MKSPRKIAEIELDAGLAGKEGVDPNHASRIRIQTLLDQHASLVQQTQFADTKSAGLVTLVGLLALKGPLPLDRMMHADPVSLAAGLLAGGCILFCVLAVFPRYPGKMIRDRLSDIDRFSWPALTAPSFGPADYAEYMHKAEISQIVHSIALSNSAVARILLRKYQMLRIAFGLAALDFLVVFARNAGMV